ncbi:MAG: hypothetical protein ACI4DK_10135 [Lachnospiraceae bacterium]
MIVKDILDLCCSSVPVRLYYLDGACKPIYAYDGESSDVPSDLLEKTVYGLCSLSSRFSDLGILCINLTDYDLLNGVVRNEIE